MSKKLFPKEFINSSLENYTFKIRKQSNAIYLLLLISFFAAIISLPFIEVDIMTSSRGQINTKSRRYELQAPISGQLLTYSLEENKQVEVGDTLMTFDRSAIEEEKRQLLTSIEELDDFMEDLNRLIEIQIDEPKLKTARYKISYLQYLGGLDKRKLRKQNLERAYTRQKALLGEQVISQVDFEKIDAQYSEATIEIELYLRQSISDWKESRYGFQDRRRELSLRLSKIEDQLLKFTLVSPESGELQNVMSLKESQFIPGGIKLAELSPDNSLLATCWVPPVDIGLLRVGMAGSFRIDAFDSNDWGLLYGEIKDISYDAYIVDGRPLFKVQCDLSNSYLTLKNGFKGELRKGMTLQANFRVTSRTLYQLLFDKVENWVNPHNG